MGRGIQRRVNLLINLVACMLERKSSLKVMIENKKVKSTVVLELLVGSYSRLLWLMEDCKLVRCKCKTFLLSSFHTLLAL